MSKQVGYLVTLREQQDFPVERDGFAYLIEKGAIGVVTKAYEKDYETFFRCLIPAKRYKDELEETKIVFFDVKEEDFKALGWEEIPF
jgi:hypothetical protein